MLSCRFILSKREGEKLNQISDDVTLLHGKSPRPGEEKSQMPSVTTLSAPCPPSSLLMIPRSAAAAEAEAETAKDTTGLEELAAYSVIKAGIVLVLAEAVDFMNFRSQGKDQQSPNC